MKIMVVFLGLCIAIGLAGCEMSKPYVMTVDRIDQKVDEGNRGYLKGTPPPAQDRAGLKRPLIAVDIGLPEIEGMPSQKTKLVGSDETQAPVSQPAAGDSNIK